MNPSLKDGPAALVPQRVVHEATSKLGASSHLFLRHVHCEAEGRVLSLYGKVPSFYLKQTAQNLLQSIDGVERIDNHLVVVNPCGVSEAPV
ncbi:MAG: BON domain-containing protein [Lacipirellulaceae bacterium]